MSSSTELRVHHLSCGVIQGLSVGGRHLVCHCLLIETPSDGLVLVDAGLGARDLIDPAARLGRAFTYGYGRPKRDPALAAVAQVRALGFDPRDVRHIVLTHMDLDHVGGLVDFPEARVHVHAAEHRIAIARPDLQSRNRYRPSMWAHAPDFRTYEDTGEPWFGFEAVRGLLGLPPEILLIPLFGHTRGHTGVAVDVGGRWLLHAGDAYFDHGEVHGPSRQCTPILRVFQTFAETVREMRLHNQDRLRALTASTPEVTVFSAHDPSELPESGAVEAPRPRHP